MSAIYEVLLRCYMRCYGRGAEPWLSGCQVLSGDLSVCRAAVRHCQVPLSDQLSGAVSAVRCCRVRV